MARRLAGGLRCRRNLTGGFQAGGGNEDEIPVLLDLARVAQCLAPGVVMTAGRLEPSERCGLSPGEASLCVLRQRGEQLARGRVEVVACRDRHASVVSRWLRSCASFSVVVVTDRAGCTEGAGPVVHSSGWRG
jgi:hypothetical protein